MICEKCGTQNPDGSTFCSGCGSAITSNGAVINEEVTYADLQKQAATEKKKSAVKNHLLYLMIRIAVALIVCLVIVLFFYFKNRLSIRNVKNCPLNYGSDITVGDIIENYDYFENVEWDKTEAITEDGDNIKVVVMSCDCTIYADDLSSECTIPLCFEFSKDDTSNDIILNGILACDEESQEWYDVSYYDDGDAIWSCMQFNYPITNSDLIQSSDE